MRILVSALVLLGTAGAIAQDEGKLVKETWDAVYIGGAKAGTAHATVRAATRDGKPVLLTSLETNFQFKRYEAVVAMGLTQTCVESADGKVSGCGATMKLDKGEVTKAGKVEGDRILFKISGVPQVLPLPWDRDVVGLAWQDRLWADQKPKAGLVVKFKNYDPSLNAVVHLTATVGEREEVVVLEDRGTAEKPRGEQVRKSLWRIVLASSPVEIGGQKIPLPDLIQWVDDEGRILRTETEMPGMGRIATLRVTQGLASLKDAVPAEMPDLGLNTLVKLAKPIPRAHEVGKIVYRVTVKEEKNPETAFSQDARQKVTGAKGETFELTVRPVREPADVGVPGPVEEAFLQSTQMLDSGDAKITDLAKKLTSEEKDPWKQARILEKWVHDNMRPTAAIGMLKASQVCTDLKGDCRQHAMLTAALCRAAGVPARTAQGLVYVNDSRHGPILGFHMWTEVYVRGQWLGLDATLGKGSVGAGHIKLGDSAWKDGEGLAPLLSLVRVLGRLSIEVVAVE
jgi:hypothetical protein